MTAILQLNKPRVWFVFSAEEDLGNFSSVTNAALVGTILTAEANALVLACRYEPRARLVASITVTRLMTQLGAPLVRTHPRTLLLARRAQLTALARTVTVHAPILTGFEARRALARTAHTALMTTHQLSATVCQAGLVDTTPQAATTRTSAAMVTIKLFTTLFRTPLRQRLFEAA